MVLLHAGTKEYPPKWRISKEYIYSCNTVPSGMLLEHTKGRVAIKHQRSLVCMQG